ncbi:MAG: hypothetical protein LBL20_03100, partial [Treponema sp.]|nr:hypothetical protein [Treponema sp.]
MESGMYLYPWEIGDMETFAREYAETGCNAVAPALSYHHAHTFAASSGRCRRLRESAVSFTPEPGRYGAVKPLVNEDCARSGVVKQLRDWAGRKGVHFAAWMVLLHNSSLGERRPGLTVENLFGDASAHALCPSRGEVREYARAVVGDAIAQFVPGSVMLESVTALPAFHGGHHEIANIGISPALRWLYSLCFCPDCMAAAAKRCPGMDPGALRDRLKKLALDLVNGEYLIPGNGDAQLTQLLFEVPFLFEYQKAREEGMADFIAEMTGLIRGKGVRATVIPSATPFDVNRVFIEGMRFSLNRSNADLLLPLVYGTGETYGLVRDTIRLFDPGTPVGMAASLNPVQSPDKGAFLAGLAAAREDGCEHLYFYNFSLASRERRRWVQAFNEQEHDE